jgi:hypothetical protein
MSTITLAPYAQESSSAAAPLGIGTSWEILDPPTYFGSGSLTDDSDDSGATLGAEFDISSNHHGEPVALWFKTPDGFDPTAFLIQMRARNNEDVRDTPPPDSSRQVHTYVSSADGSTVFDVEFTSPGGGNPSPISPLLLAEVAVANDYTWWGSNGAASIDLDNPTQAGGWYQLDFTGDPGDKAALTGDGLRLDLGVYVSGAAGDPHLNWIDLFEVRLLVAGHARGAYPLRRYPPVNNGGSGPTRHWPRTVNRRAGGTY